MRVIKFRVWDTRLKMYHNPASYMLNGRGEFVEYPMDAHEQYSTDKELVIQQFTGVTDKNGKDIYEGDIINRILTSDRENQYMAVVEFNDRNHGRIHGWNLMESYKGELTPVEYYYGQGPESYHMVVGNICENKIEDFE